MESEQQTNVDDTDSSPGYSSKNTNFISLGCEQKFDDDFQARSETLAATYLSKKKAVTFDQGSSFVDPVLQRVFQEFAIYQSKAEMTSNIDEPDEKSSCFETNKFYTSEFTHDNIDRTAVELAKIKAQSIKETVGMICEMIREVYLLFLTLITVTLFMFFVAVFVNV
jgi:hypothetical protein